MELQDFIKEKTELKMEVVKAPTNPNMESNGTEMDHWYVTLTNGGEPMSLFYSQGLGHRKPNHFAAKMAHCDYPGRDTQFTGNRTVSEEDFNQTFKPIPPTLGDIIDCLASDSCGIANARDFEEWASEYGYDTDSRKAYDTFKVCATQSHLFEHLIGQDIFEELLYEVDRL